MTHSDKRGKLSLALEHYWGKLMGRFKQGDSVKIEFRDETKNESEWMWLLVVNSDDKQRLVFGTLDNEPVVNTDMRLGTELAISYDLVREYLPASSFNQ
jgi:uncharacterized protein YegJ (DUF2314 family)